MCEVMRKYEEIAKTEERTAIAKKLIASGDFTDERISELTGLSVEEISAIRSGSVA